MSRGPHPIRRLRDGGDGTPEQRRLGELLARVEEEKTDAGAQARVWRAIETTIDVPPTPWRQLFWPGLALAGAAAASLLFWLAPMTPSQGEGLPLCVLSEMRGEVAIGALATPAHPGDTVAWENQIVTGNDSYAWVRCGGEATLLLREETALVLRGFAAIELEQGSVVASVRRDPSAGQTVVRAGSFEVAVLSTLFAVAKHEQTEVQVSHGAVWLRGPETDLTVRAKQCWQQREGRVVDCNGVALHTLPSAQPAPERTAETNDSLGGMKRAVETKTRSGLAMQPLAREPGVSLLTEAAPVPRASLPADPTERAVALEMMLSEDENGPGSVDQQALLYDLGVAWVQSGKPRKAEAVFARLAEQSGPRAALALYELARLRGRELEDPSGAIAALRSYQQRFADGPLIREVGLDLVDTLRASGQRADAVIEIDDFLTRFADTERRRELVMLRGSLLRELGRCVRALSDFDRVAAQGDDAFADDAAYLAMLCVGQIGERDELRRRAAAYLERFPNGRHRDAVRSVLGL